MDEQKNKQSLFLTVDEVAQRYRISVRQLRRLTQLGELPQPLQFGNCQRWPLQALEEFELEQISENINSFCIKTKRRITRRK